jgi:hypothetical protein
MDRSARCAFCAIFHIAIGVYVWYNSYCQEGKATATPRLEVNPKGGEENLKKVEKTS